MRRTLESIMLLICGLSLIAVSINGGVPTLDSAGQRGLAWHQLAFVYGILFLVLSALSYGISFLGTTLQASVSCSVKSAFDCEAMNDWAGSFRSNSAFPLIGLAAALSFGGWLRWSYINQPMRLDEAYSFLTFVDTAWTNVFLYPFPNNHVLNSILERTSCAVFGSDPFGIRFPALFFGMALIVAVYRVGRKFGGACGGVFAALSVAIWPYLVFLSTNGRGYSLVAFATILMADVAIDHNGNLRPSCAFALSVFAALGMLTMPSMLFPISGLLLWMLLIGWNKTDSWRKIITEFAAPFAALFLILTMVLYTPVALVSGGLQGVTGNKEAIALAMGQFTHQLGPHAELAIRALTVDVPNAVVMALCLTSIVGAVFAWKSRNYSAACFLPLVLLGSMIVLLVKRSIPFPRTWIYLVPVFLVTADYGLAQVVRKWPLWVRCVTLTVLIVSAGVFSRHLISANAIANYSETGAASEVPGIAKELERLLMPKDYICALSPTNVTAAYYLRHKRADMRSSTSTESPRIIFVHNKLARPSLGIFDGWQTLTEYGNLIADIWTRQEIPRMVKEPAMDCWQVDASSN